MSPLVRVAEVALLALKLGVIGFGGPAAHLALLEEEVVVRRRWIPRERFLDLVGATNLIPGPNSTEMVIHIGLLRAGWPGLVAAGLGFIIPAASLSAALGWAYRQYGSLPDFRPIFAGIQPAVLVVIAAAMWRLARTAVRSWELAALGAAVLLACLLGAHSILALVAGGLLGMVWLRAGPWGGWRSGGTAAACAGALAGGGPVALAASSGAAAVPSSLALGLVFLKVGALLYGTGYVLVAFLEEELVLSRGWLTSGELLDAIAIGQVTPGPLLSTASFIGYYLGGIPGSVAATAGIFLPSFVLVALLGRLLPRLRRSRWAGSFLDAVNASAVAVMLDATVGLGRQALTSWPAVLIALAAVPLALWWRVQPMWLVLGGAAAGWALGYVF